jgi:hypothetical protein
MKRALLLLSAFAAATTVTPAAAQKVPPASTRATAPSQAAPEGAKVLHPVSPAAPAPAPVTPQAAAPAPPAGATHSAGLSMPAYTGTTPEAAVAYAGRFVHQLDSTIVTLVATFRNTSGQPVIGARSPETLSRRERDRWSRCRDLYWDLTTYQTAVASLRQALPASPNVQLKVAQLDSAFDQSTAAAECDNISSMIAAPDRFTPWQDSYEAAARHFYRDFYPQIRRIHEAARALLFALNLPMPPGLPQNPPYAGATPT